MCPVPPVFVFPLKRTRQDRQAAAMNLMFRKNFHADKEPGYGFGKSSARAGRSKAHHGKRARDAGYSSMPEDRGGDRAGFYRTHLFLNPSSACQSCGGAVEEETTSAGLQQPPDSAAPVAPRRSSVSLIKWPRKSSGSTGGGGTGSTIGAIGGRFDSLDVAGAGSAAGSASAPPSRQVSASRPTCTQRPPSCRAEAISGIRSIVLFRCGI